MRFPNGNTIVYSQDFRQLFGLPPDVDFDVEVISEDSVRLRAPGYGAKGAYGNGPIIVHRGMQHSGDMKNHNLPITPER